VRARPAGWAPALVVLVAMVVVGPPAGGAPQTAATGQDVTVQLDRSEVSAGPGEKITIESTVRNNGGEPLEGYVAHLNILTTDKSVYVDPEDWSAERTQYLDPLGPGESVTLSWSVRAVTSGPLILFVSVTSPDSQTVSSSGPLNLTVEGQRVVNAGGVMPLVTWMPASVLALLVATLVRRRRHR
jgi:uncharacterized membrane protein